MWEQRRKQLMRLCDKPHYENEAPFELPENWEWTTINDICSKIGSGSTPRGSNYAEIGIPFFRSQNVYNDGLVYDDIKYISDEVHESMIGTEVQAEDLLLNITGGSLGRCAIVPSDFPKGNVSQHVCILRTIVVLPAYLHLFIISDYFSSTMILSGSGREGLPKYSLEIMQFPLPPLTEQHRIVAAVEKWFSLIDKLETEKEDLQTSITQAKSKILELAIHGKLVPQDLNDEPAIDLLKRINPKFTPCDNAHILSLLLVITRIMRMCHQIGLFVRLRTCLELIPKQRLVITWTQGLSQCRTFKIHSKIALVLNQELGEVSRKVTPILKMAIL